MGTEVIVHQILQSSWITDWSHSLPLSAYASQGCHVLWIRDRHGLVPHLAHPSVLRPVHRCAVFQPHHHHHHHHQDHQELQDHWADQDPADHPDHQDQEAHQDHQDFQDLQGPQDQTAHQDHSVPQPLHHHHHHHHHAQRSASPPVYHPAQPPVAHRRSIKLYNEERRLDETILWKYDGRTNLLAQRTHNNTTTLLLLGVTSLS